MYIYIYIYVHISVYIWTDPGDYTGGSPPHACMHAMRGWGEVPKSPSQAPGSLYYTGGSQPNFRLTVSGKPAELCWVEDGGWGVGGGGCCSSECTARCRNYSGRRHGRLKYKKTSASRPCCRPGVLKKLRTAQGRTACKKVRC